MFLFWHSYFFQMILKDQEPFIEIVKIAKIPFSSIFPLLRFFWASYMPDREFIVEAQIKKQKCEPKLLMFF